MQNRPIFLQLTARVYSATVLTQLPMLRRIGRITWKLAGASPCCAILSLIGRLYNGSVLSLRPTV